MSPFAILIPLALLLAEPAEPEPEATRPLVTLRAVRPDRQLEALLKLFEGSRAGSPAAALAAWKRAAADPKRLGKAAEGIIATFNPQMVAEFRSLDDATVGLRHEPDRDRWTWRATLPRDDGTIGAVAATTLLSGGRLGPPLPGTMGDSPVVYLTSGPAPLLARVGPALALSNDPAQLARAALDAARPPVDPKVASGWVVRVDPGQVGRQFPTLAGRRVAEVFRADHSPPIEGRLRVDGATLVLDAEGLVRPRADLAPVDPAWAAIVPARGALAAWSARLDPRPEAWGPLFDLVDRVERVDPERAGVASSRLRLALAARAVGVRLEADVWPHLVGVSGWVGPEGEDLAGRGVVALHLDDEGAARRVVAGARATRRPGPIPDAPPDGDAQVDLGRVAGRPLRLHRLGRSVALAWGDGAWAASLGARDHPDRSARAWLGASRSGTAPTRAGALWLDQALRGRPEVADLAASLAEGPPLRWAGGMAPGPADEVWLDGLDATIRRFLDRLPFDPPPDR